MEKRLPSHQSVFHLRSTAHPTAIYNGTAGRAAQNPFIDPGDNLAVGTDYCIHGFRDSLTSWTASIAFQPGTSLVSSVILIAWTGKAGGSNVAMNQVIWFFGYTLASRPAHTTTERPSAANASIFTIVPGFVICRTRTAA